MLYLKGCPKCGGTLVDDTDHYGARRLCIMCGLDVLEPPRFLDDGALDVRYRSVSAAPVLHYAGR